MTGLGAYLSLILFCSFVVVQISSSSLPTPTTLTQLVVKTASTVTQAHGTTTAGGVIMSYLGVGVSPGSVPVYNGTDLKEVDRKVRLAEVILRALVFFLALVALLLVSTDSQVQEIFTIQKKAKFTDMKALVFLVVVNAMAAAYSLVQSLRCGLSMLRGSVLLSKPLACLIFSCDQLMAYLMLAAVGAALQSALLAKFSEPELQWMKLCDMYGKFCNRSGEGIASSLVAWVSMMMVSGISAFSLFRLYGGDRGTKTHAAGWF